MENIQLDNGLWDATARTLRVAHKGTVGIRAEQAKEEFVSAIESLLKSAGRRPTEETRDSACQVWLSLINIAHDADTPRSHYGPHWKMQFEQALLNLLTSCHRKSA